MEVEDADIEIDDGEEFRDPLIPYFIGVITAMVCLLSWILATVIEG